MFRDYILPITQLVVFGPIVLFRVLFTVAAVAALLTFLLPGLMVALWAILGVVLSAVWDFIVHPTFLKLWVLICIIAAFVIVIPHFRFPSLDLPTPKPRRGRPVDDEESAVDRAQRNLERRRKAFSRHKRRTYSR